MYVERGESPINFIEQMTPDFFPIRSQADWTKFRDMVDAAEGKRNVNARLYTDIAETNVYIACRNKCRLQWYLRRQRSQANRQDSF